MDEFETVDDVVRWFTEGPHGHLYDAADLRNLVQRMVSMPNPFGYGGNDCPVTPDQAWNWIHDFHLMANDGRSGWITREGKMLSAAWGAHERLLHWLGMEAGEVEAAGWVRSSPHGWQCRFKLSREQINRLEEGGHLVDDGAERLKPVWAPPPKSDAIEDEDPVPTRQP
jgi:hypothetical protein